MSPLNFDDGTWPDGYRPVKQGLRHLTDVVVLPPAGIIVDFLCGGTILVGHVPPTPVIYDCTHCADVYRERSQPPVSQVAPSRLAPPLDGRTWGPVDVSPPASAGPRPLGGVA